MSLDDDSWVGGGRGTPCKGRPAMPDLRPPCAPTSLSLMSQAVLLCAELYAILCHQHALQGQTGPQVQSHREALEERYQHFLRTYTASSRAWYAQLRHADPAVAARLKAVWASYGMHVAEEPGP